MSKLVSFVSGYPVALASLEMRTIELLRN